MQPDRPKIVVLDGYTNNPGDLSWERLDALGDVTVHPRTPMDEVIDRCRGASAILTNKVPISDEVLGELPDLQYIGVLATGYNIIDIEAARRRGVTVTNVPAYSTESTAQHAFALLLALTNHVGPLAADSEERWPASADFSYWDQPLIELAGLTCGVVGFGAIGQAFCRRAKAFGMTVLDHTRSPDKHREAAAELGVELVEMDDLLARSDVVSLHCPLTPETKHLIDAKAIAKMKPTALLINASRGPVIHEAAVAKALNEGRLGGAGLDVLSSEPPEKENPLLSARNCLVTPHVAWATTAARRRSIEIAAGNVKAFLAGEPRNVVS